MIEHYQRPVLSIVIPTRNRLTYVRAAIRNVLNIPSDRVELVLQDNSDNDELETFLAENGDDRRIRYQHTWERLDVVENYNRGMESATGEYVCAIGDDDGVNPEIAAAAQWAMDNGFDALLPTRPVQFWWPDIRFRTYGDSLAGTLDIRPFTGRVTFPDVESEMRRCVRYAGQDFFDLPKVYYGLVKRDLMTMVKERTGTHFPGPSPDLAGAMAVSTYVKRLARMDYPLFIPGSSRNSGAGLGAMKKHVGRLEDQPHLPRQYVNNWSKLVPSFWSRTTIWGEDVVQALMATGREDILREFNVPLLHAMCVVFNPEYSFVTMRNFRQALRETHRSYLTGLIQFSLGYASTWGLRVQSHATRFLKPGGWLVLSGVGDIERAGQLLTEYLGGSGRRFDERVNGA